MGGRGQRVLQFISLNTLVDVIRVPKACNSGKQLPIDMYLLMERGEISSEFEREKILLNRLEI